jgi:hypothetical protein
MYCLSMRNSYSFVFSQDQYFDDNSDWFTREEQEDLFEVPSTLEGNLSNDLHDPRGENDDKEDEYCEDAGNSDDEEIIELFREAVISENFQWTPTADNSPRFSKIVRTESYEGAAKVYGKGETFLERFGRDEQAQHRSENPYFPLASRDEWEFTNVLLRMHCSQAEKTELLNTGLVSFTMT